jgi:hypothetical protein
MLCTRSMRLLAALAAVAAVTCPTSVFADWQEQSSSTQTGPVRLLLRKPQIVVCSLLFADRAHSSHVWCLFGHVVQGCPSHYHWLTPNDTLARVTGAVGQGLARRSVLALHLTTLQLCCAAAAMKVRTQAARLPSVPDESSRIFGCKDIDIPMCSHSIRCWSQGTIYGKGQNSKGACSYGTNFADTTGLPWSSPPAGASDGGTGYPMTFIAMNAPQFALTASCGTCVWFRGTGECVSCMPKRGADMLRRMAAVHGCGYGHEAATQLSGVPATAGPGIGVESRKISSEWQYGFVDNICPECKKGALDLARNFDVGDGIWTLEWHAVPCNVSAVASTHACSGTPTSSSCQFQCTTCPQLHRAVWCWARPVAKCRLPC